METIIVGLVIAVFVYSITRPSPKKDHKNHKEQEGDKKDKEKKK